jgi:hypothetical protein
MASQRALNMASQRALCHCKKTIHHPDIITMSQWKGIHTKDLLVMQECEENALNKALDNSVALVLHAIATKLMK